MKTPKNILFLIDGLAGGGAERLVLTLAEAMVAEGDEVMIASLRKECAYPIPKGVSYLLVEDTSTHPFRRLTELRRRARALDQALEDAVPGKKFDLIVSHLLKTDRIVAFSQKCHDAWRCLHCALTISELDNKRGWRRWRKRRQLLKTYDRKKLITVSQALQEDVLAVGIRPESMVTIYNPFDLKKIRSLAEESTPFDNERFLLHVGRFHPQKRHDRLLEAFQQSGYAGKLLLLGDGSVAAKASISLQAEQLGISDRILFAGFVSNPYPIMRAAEALILSSDYEGLPSVLIEALACGTQVISTNCPYGPAEILTGKLSQGLSNMTAPALAEAVRRVLANPIVITEEMLAPFKLKECVQKYHSLKT
jgi:glycosyltransferase involved in cell wall biosynthesis